MKQTENGGITLIALVITIIVMLILVGVTINLSLNGGLFGYAKQAVKETNKALTEEEMLSKGFIKEKREVQVGNKKVTEWVWSPINNYLSNSSETFCPQEDEGKWDYIYNEDGTITLTKYTGSATELVVPNRYKTDTGEYWVVSKVQSNNNVLQYKEEYECNDVVRNGKYFFNIIGEVTDEFTSNIEEITISDGVEIGVMAFYSISSLETVKIGKNITTIDSYAFQESGLETIKISSDIKKINLQAFCKCGSLTTVDFSEATQLVKIGPAAFATTNITELNLSNTTSLEKIWEMAFYGCTELTGELEIPSKVTEIGKQAFYNCEKLTSLDLSKATSLTKIESKAFYKCTGLTGELEIPSNVTVADDAFSGTNITLSSIITNNAFKDRTDLTRGVRNIK